ncbi:hypothetical protein [Streptococcus pseudopneumoniae]|uniref:hypothetical protein n=1 Tax=Streptococcus pseudopneumoniae TaxID=257758 RepID=UPI000C1F7E4F|nr:hypothetical protein [Streptococcus pseudopneumoniae]
MDEFFKEFEEKIGIVEEKLDILSEWHLSKKHHGATEISEDCRKAITRLWIEFHQLIKTYKQQEAEHETFLDANISNLLGELKKHDELMAENSIRLGKERPNWLLFDYLNKAVRSFTDPGKLATSDNMNIWWYLQDLVIKDLRERGLLKK